MKKEIKLGSVIVVWLNAVNNTYIIMISDVIHRSDSYLEHEITKALK